MLNINIKLLKFLMSEFSIELEICKPFLIFFKIPIIVYFLNQMKFFSYIFILIISNIIIMQ